MAVLGSDEKLCPKCAEVIKAAAVRCRYCGYEPEVGIFRQIFDRSEPRRSQGGTGCLGLLLGVGLVVMVASCLAGGDKSSSGASAGGSEASVAAEDMMTPEQQKGCGELLDKLKGPRQIVDRISGIARVDADWWGTLPSNDQAQIINWVGCSAYGVRLPGLRGLNQVVIIKDSSTGDTLASAAEGQMLR